ncbi:MAG: M28 family peptidase, partial [Proteobacteria bacterium]|nr:M28 family peptidase [Pseudomonadota bacterium]
IGAGGLPMAGVGAGGLPMAGIGAGGLPMAGVGAGGLPMAGIGAGGTQPPTAGSPAPGTPMQQVCDTVASFPAPMYNPAEAVDWWENFVRTYTRRVHDSQPNIMAGQHLRDELTAAGYQTQILELQRGSNTVRVVEGIKRGLTKPDNYLGIISHYDVVGNTVQGAYDDGAGVAAAMQICKNLAPVPTNKSIACLFFDAEEIGRQGSQQYVADFVSNGMKKFDHGFGYDMVGLNRPGFADWKLYGFMGYSPASQDRAANHKFIEAILFDCQKTGIMTTRPNTEVLTSNNRNSDERSFEEGGVPVLRFAGGRSASDYGAWHQPNDTIMNVYSIAGGRPNFVAGMKAAISLSHFVILGYDQFDTGTVPQL